MCIKEFEDRNFDHHIGIDPKGIVRALKQNIKNGRVVSGASTISMQVIRLSRENPRRTYLEKALEMARALRLELRFSKNEILSFYSDQAPMGGNVVGLETAAWRYFKKRPKDLSWAESATLAVLPNAPSIIFPGTRNNKLRLKRNRLLHRLYELGHLDETSYELSIAEDVPQRPKSLPVHSSHLINLLEKEGSLGESVQTSIDINLQERVIELSRYHMEHWEANYIFNCSVLITEVSSGDVVAYMGNLHDAKDNSYVDVIQSQRSTGSILKPLLYSSMLEEGEVLPNQLIPDIPTNIAGYKPVNFHETFDGAVPASECLIRSLNVPSVLMLRQHGVQKFHQQLQLLGFNQMNRASNHYGLSLILGGAETNLWELNRAYGFLANRLIHFNKESGSYPSQPYSLSV
ncbi:MAG: transglycosylase domain-containing protein, partial [Flavobacteriales bacterium]